MERISYLKILKHGWRTVFLITIGAIAVSLVLSLVQPFLYSSQVRLLVIPWGGGTDAYSALKSAETISENISQIIYTSSFFDKVIKSRTDITYIWSQDEIKRRKQWEKMIKTEVIYGTGMIDITVYHKDKTQASAIANAIASVLISEGKDYFGMPGLEIKMVSTPLASRYPVKPNLLLNVFMGLILGLLAGIAFTILTYHPALRPPPPYKELSHADRAPTHEIHETPSERKIVSMHNHFK
jgi:capsular polysaccharide biosynthesis protein